MDEYLVFFGEQCWRVRVIRVLRLLSVVELDVRVWLMLRFVGCSVLKKREGLGDIVEHQDVDPAAVVVPVHVHAKVALSISVNGTFVVFVGNFCKMVSVLQSNIFDAKVVNTESE